MEKEFLINKCLHIPPQKKKGRGDGHNKTGLSRDAIYYLN